MRAGQIANSRSVVAGRWPLAGLFVPVGPSGPLGPPRPPLVPSISPSPVVGSWGQLPARLLAPASLDSHKASPRPSEFVINKKENRNSPCVLSSLNTTCSASRRRAKLLDPFLHRVPSEYTTAVPVPSSTWARFVLAAGWEGPSVARGRVMRRATLPPFQRSKLQ